MISDKPKTFRELKVRKSVYNLANYYKISHDDLNLIYEFLIANKDRKLNAGKTFIDLFEIDGKLFKRITVSCLLSMIGDVSFDGVSIDDAGEHVLTHYVPKSSGRGGGGSYTGGSSGRSSWRPP